MPSLFCVGKISFIFVMASIDSVNYVNTMLRVI